MRQNRCNKPPHPLQQGLEASWQDKKSPSERHDDDEPDGSTDKGSGDTDGGNSNSPSGSGSPDPSAGPSSSQSFGSYRGFAHTRPSSDGNGNYASVSDALPVVRKYRPESIFWENLSQLTQNWSSQLHVIGRLGSGGRAIVDEVEIEGYTRTMALKTLKSSFHNSSREWRREVETLAKLKEHPHIVKLVRIYLKQGYSALLIQPVADYDLDKYLFSYTATLKEQRNIWLWFSCLASGLEFIHENGVLHNDIKPQNILVEDQRVLFADFGSSSTIDETRQLRLRAFHHTKLYAAPEVEQGGYTTASDVFSLGCVFLEMVTVLISRDKWTQLRAFQNSLYHQKMSIHSWALEWRKQILLHSHGEAIEKHLGPILEVCSKMTQLEQEKRPNTADLSRQVSLHLDCECDYRLSFARQSDGSLSRKRPNQGTERRSKRLAQPRNVKAAENVTVRSDLVDAGASSNALRSAKSLGWKNLVSKIKPRRKETHGANRANVLSNITSHFSNIVVSDPSNQSPSTDVNRAKDGNCDASPSRTKSLTMMDRFLEESDPLEDLRVSGWSKHNNKGIMRHNSKLVVSTTLNLLASKTDRKITKTKSLPLPTERAVFTKNANYISRNRSFDYPLTNGIKDVGSQFSIPVQNYKVPSDI
ncbi:MAG: hypothetical protein Q9167_002087 [Letrouitia subvulpina]